MLSVLAEFPKGNLAGKLGQETHGCCVALIQVLSVLAEFPKGNLAGKVGRETHGCCVASVLCT